MGFMRGFFWGAVIGGAAAILLAPRSGEETREQLQVKARELQDQARDRVNEMQAQAQTRVDETRGQLQNIIDRGSTIIPQTSPPSVQ